MPPGRLGVAVRALAVSVSAYVLYVAVFAILDPLVLVAIFFALTLALLFLIVGHRSRIASQRPPAVDVVASAVALACGVYFVVQADVLVQRISLLDPLTPLDIAVGSAVCLLTLEATRRTVGLGLTVLVVAMLLYNLFGDRLDGILRHGTISYEHLLDQTVFTTNGVFGAPLRVAATYAFLFVMFGTLLERCGGSEFFFRIAAAVSGRQTGGPAKVAVFSSALYGTVSGSPTSDVVTTGSVTIPMMRRLGYPRTLAGAVEVASSSSGGLIPPVMGSAAFIMVEVTGIAYLEIARAAILPALLFLLGVFIQVHYVSRRHGLGAMDPDQIPDVRQALREGGLFVVPLVTLVWALFQGYSISLVAVIGLISVLVVAMLRRATRPGLAGVLDALAVSAMRMVTVAAACAAAGLVVGGISMTGLSGKLALGIFALAGDQAFLTLLLTALIAILLGMGMPTPSAYIMSAVLTAPVLTGLGMPLLNVHFFLLFFAVLSAITPPVAVAAYAAASLAEANPIAIAARACVLAAPAFVIPFAFAFRPELLGQGDWPTVAYAFISSAAAVGAMAIAFAGHFQRQLALAHRLALLASAALLLAPDYLTDAIGILVLLLVLANDWRRRQDFRSSGSRQLIDAAGARQVGPDGRSTRRGG